MLFRSPAKCPMDFVVTAFSKIQKGSFQLAVQTSRDKGIKKSRLPQDNPNPGRQGPTNRKNKKRYRPNVSCYECGEVGHYSMDCPKRKQLLSTDKAQVKIRRMFRDQGTQVQDQAPSPTNPVTRTTLPRTRAPSKQH